MKTIIGNITIRLIKMHSMYKNIIASVASGKFSYISANNEHTIIQTSEGGCNDAFLYKFNGSGSIKHLSGDFKKFEGYHDGAVTTFVLCRKGTKMHDTEKNELMIIDNLGYIRKIENFKEESLKTTKF